jgi:hypothetical protein
MADVDEFGREIPNLTDYLNADVKVKSDAWGFGGVMPWLTTNCKQILLVVIGTILKLGVDILAVAASGVSAMLEQANPEVGRLAAQILGGMFGNDFAATIPGGILSTGNLEENAEAVGRAVLQSVFGPLQLQGGGTVEPGVERAESYLGAIANLCTRGFLLDLVEEFVPHFHLTAVHHLEHELLSGLGLGRIARTVLRPIVTTLVADPAQWALNLSYRPKLLGEGTAIRQFVVGAWDRAQLDDELGRQGFSSDRIDALVNDHKKRVAVDDLFTLVEHSLIDRGDAADHLRAMGYDDDGSTMIWEALEARRKDGLLQRAAAVWLSKYQEGLIDHDTFVRSLATLELPDDVAQLYALIGGASRETPRRLLGVGDLRAAWTKNLITQGQFHDYVIRLGYSDDDATTLVLLELATLRDKNEADQARKQAEADRRAQLAAEKAAAEAKRIADKAAAEQERRQKAADVAAQKARVAADELALKAFAIDAAAAKTLLVNQQKDAGLVTADAAQLAHDQIAADLAELLATIAGQQAVSKASFERQILELRQADREATIAQQLEDVDLALISDQAARTVNVNGRLSAVDDTLARKLADLEDLYAARAHSIDDDLADATAAIDASTLPTAAERVSHVAQQIDELDVTLARKLADIAAEYDERRTANDDNLAGELIKQTPHDLEATRLDLSQSQAERLAQQQHDLSVDRLHQVADQALPLTIAEAGKQKTALVTKADKARSTLATDKLAAQLSAKQTADAERVTLKSVAAQITPITEAEAARRRRTIAAAAAAAKRSEQITETEIAKGEADAQAAQQRAAATVQATRARTRQAAAAAGSREAAQTAAAAALATLQAQIDRQRLELERQLAADQVNAPT